MKIKKVTLVYYSPTGTSKKVLEGIARGIGIGDIERVDLTLSVDGLQPKPVFSDELVLIGAPVYGGRLPVDAVTRFKQMRANGTLVILVVLYGNRDFEDALLELKDLAIERGFTPVAGGAFIGEHSFASKDVPIANGRPDAHDIQIALEFGEKIKDKITALKPTGEHLDLKVSGRYPYEANGARALAISPVTNNEICAGCGTCSGVCPTAAILIDDCVKTEVERCTRCCACIKSCPTGARFFEDSMMQNLAKGLSQYFSYPKEPRVFGVDG